MAEDLHVLLREAETLYEQSEWDQAQEKYLKILQRDPQNEEACYKIATIYSIRGLITSVVNQYFQLMDILEAKGDLDQAVEVAKWIKRIQPENDKARMKIILVNKKKGNIEEVVKQSLQLARLYIELGQGDQSIMLLQGAQEYSPDNLDIGLELAEMYMSHGHIQEAAQQYRKIANAYLERNQYEKAADAFRRMKVIVSDDEQLLLTLGNIYVSLNRFNEAEAEFRAVLRLDLNNVEALLALGNVCQLKGQFRDAILAFNKILSINPQEVKAKEKLGELHQAQGNHIESIKNYLSAAHIYQSSDETDRAVRLYQRVLTLDPTNPTACRELTNLGAPLVGEEEELETSTYQPSILPMPELVPSKLAVATIPKEEVVAPPPLAPMRARIEEKKVEEAMVTTQMPSQVPTRKRAEELPSFDISDVDLPSLDGSGVELPSLELPSLDVPSMGEQPNLPSLNESSGNFMPGFAEPGAPSMEMPSFDMPSMGAPSMEMPSFDMPSMEIPGRDTSSRKAPLKDLRPMDEMDLFGRRGQDSDLRSDTSYRSYGTKVSPGTVEPQQEYGFEDEQFDERDRMFVSKREKTQTKDALIPKGGLNRSKSKGLVPKGGKKGGIKPKLGAEEEEGSDEVRSGLLSPKGKGSSLGKPKMSAGKKGKAQKEILDRPVIKRSSQIDDDLPEQEKISPKISSFKSVEHSFHTLDTPMESPWGTPIPSESSWSDEGREESTLGGDLLMPPLESSMDNEQILMPSPDDLSAEESSSFDSPMDDLLEPPGAFRRQSRQPFMANDEVEEWPYDIEKETGELGRAHPMTYSLPDISMPSIDMEMPQEEPFESMPLQQAYDIPSGEIRGESRLGFTPIFETPNEFSLERAVTRGEMASEGLNVPVSFWEDPTEVIQEEAITFGDVHGAPTAGEPAIMPMFQKEEEGLGDIEWGVLDTEGKLSQQGMGDMAGNLIDDRFSTMDASIEETTVRDWQIEEEPTLFSSEVQKVVMEVGEKKKIFEDIALPPITTTVSETEAKMSMIEEEILRLRDILEAGDYSSAIETYNKIITAYPGNIELRTEMADLYFNYGLIDEALEQFKILSEKDPQRIDYLQRQATLNLWEQRIDDAVSVLLAIAKSFRERNEITLSLEYYQSVLALDKDNMTAREEIVDIYLEQEAIQVSLYHLNILANLAIERKEPEKAIHLLKKIYTLTSDIAVQQKLAKIYEEYNYSEEAVNEFILIAKRYRDQGDYERAGNCLARVVEIRPDNLDAHHQLIELYGRLGNKEKSIEERYAVATIYLQTGEKDEALNILEEILRSKQDQHEARHKLIDVYLDKGMIQRALDEATILSDVYFKEKKVEQAIELYQKLVSADPQNLVLRERLAHFYMMHDLTSDALKEVLKIADELSRKEEWDEAIKTYKKALQIDEKNADVRHKLAMILLEKKRNHKDALIELQKVFEVAPDHRENTKRYIQVLLQEGKPEEAIKVLDKFISIDSANEVMKEEIINSYVKKIEENADDVQSRFFLGIIYKELRMLDEAIEQFQKTKRMDEYFLLSSNMLAMCFAMKPGMQQIALRTLKKAVETQGFSDEDKMELRYNLAILLESLNNPKEALTQYQEVYKVDITFKDVAQRIKQLKEQLAGGGTSKVTRLVPREPGD